MNKLERLCAVTTRTTEELQSAELIVRLAGLTWVRGTKDGGVTITTERRGAVTLSADETLQLGAILHEWTRDE